MSEISHLPRIQDPIEALVHHEEWPALMNVEAEAGLLGALMVDNSFYPMVASIVSESDFFEPVHGRVFEKIGQLISLDQVATPVTLKPMFESDPAMRGLGGPGYLAKLTGSNVVLIGARAFAQQVRDLSKLRQLRASLLDTLRDLNDTRAWIPLPEILEKMDAATQAVISVDTQTSVVPFDRAWDQAVQHSIDVQEGLIPPSLHVDGLPDWNDLLGGMRGGNLIILAGRPGMGKTAVACTVATSCARAGIGTAFFSREMDVQDLMERMICDVCYDHGRSFTYNAMKRGKLNSQDRQMIADARARVADWPVIFDAGTNSKIGSITGQMRRLKKMMAKKGHDLKVVIVDYLGLLSADKTTDNRVNEISQITRALKAAAMELDVSIIALSQLSRAVEQRDDKRPKLSDLRDSGSIEQDADAVIFVYRDEYYLKESEPKLLDKRRADWEIDMAAARDKIDLIAAKVRAGPTGKRTCHFFAAYQTVRGSKFFEQGQY